MFYRIIQIMVKEGQKRDSPNADSPDRDSGSAPDHSSIPKKKG